MRKKYNNWLCKAKNADCAYGVWKNKPGLDKYRTGRSLFGSRQFKSAIARQVKRLGIRFVIRKAPGGALIVAAVSMSGCASTSGTAEGPGLLEVGTDLISPISAQDVRDFQDMLSTMGFAFFDEAEFNTLLRANRALIGDDDEARNQTLLDWQDQMDQRREGRAKWCRDCKDK